MSFLILLLEALKPQAPDILQDLARSIQKNYPIPLANEMLLNEKKKKHKKPLSKLNLTSSIHIYTDSHVPAIFPMMGRIQIEDSSI